MRSLRPRASLRRATQMSDAVSIRNLSLPTWSVLNRRPEDAEGASPAMNSFRYRFPAGRKRTVVYIFMPCSRIASGADSNRAQRGCMLGVSSYVLLLSLEWERYRFRSLVRAGIGGTNSLSSEAVPLRRVPGWWMLRWEAKQLPRSGQPVVRRPPGCPRLGQPEWSGCLAVIGWTIC